MLLSLQHDYLERSTSWLPPSSSSKPNGSNTKIKTKQKHWRCPDNAYSLRTAHDLLYAHPFFQL